MKNILQKLDEIKANNDAFLSYQKRGGFSSEWIADGPGPTISTLERALRAAIIALKANSMCPTCLGWECDHYGRRGLDSTVTLDFIAKELGVEL